MITNGVIKNSIPKSRSKTESGKNDKRLNHGVPSNTTKMPHSGSAQFAGKAGRRARIDRIAKIIAGR